jgi:ankyrin repeat protein
VAESGNYDICGTLLEYGADLESRDLTGKTPLHTFFNPVVGMLLNNNREVVDEEIMAPDTSGMTIVQYAAWSSKSEPRHLVPYLRSGEIYPFLARDYAGRLLLHFAAHRGNIPMLEYLLSLPHDIGLKVRDMGGQSALHYAVQSKRTEAINLLVSNGADLNAVDIKGWTVLHCAAARNNLPAVERVVKLCGKKFLWSQDRDGRTPAELAYLYKAFKTADYLDSLGTQELDLRRQPHPPREESRTVSLSNLVCYLSRRPLNSVHLVVVAVVVIWYIFYPPGKCIVISL